MVPLQFETFRHLSPPAYQQLKPTIHDNQVIDWTGLNVLVTSFKESDNTNRRVRSSQA
jgi:hypothetical protein